MMRMSRKALTILFLTIALFLIGTNIQTGWLFVIIAFLLALLAYSLVAPFVTTKGLSFERAISPEVFEGEEVPVSLKIINQARRARFLFEVGDEFFALGEEQKARYSVALVKPGGTVSVKYKLKAASRGVHRGGEITLSSGGPFGLFRLRKRVFVPSPVLVYPSYFEITSFPILESGSYPVELFHELKAKGFGLEYYGVREYQPSDSLRFVHWRSTARSGELVVREFEQEMAAPVNLVLDLKKDHSLGEAPANNIEYMIKIAASICCYTLKAGHPIQLIASQGSETSVLTEPDWWQTLEWLAKLEASGDQDINELIAQSIHRIPVRSTVVIFLTSSFPLPLDSIRTLQAKRVRVAAVLLNGASFSLTKTESVIAGEEEFNRLAGELAANRLVVYPVNKGDDLSRCFSRSSLLSAG